MRHSGTTSELVNVQEGHLWIFSKASKECRAVFTLIISLVLSCRIRNRCSEVCSSGGSNDLVFANARLSKSESSDRGMYSSAGPFNV